jgi:Ca2+/Na+ antiporter
MELHPSITFLAGLIIIIVGAELLLRGASRIAI